MVAERFPVEAGHIMMFARAIGDANPAFHLDAGDTEPEDVLAPPTFVQSSAQFDPEYHLRPKPGQPWHGSGRDPGVPAPNVGGGTGLHAEQHFEYHRPVRAGDVLSATVIPSAQWEKAGRRAGKLVFTETVTEYRDQHGDLVVTARRVSVRTERPVDR